jgi:Ca-activated chloride channel homolog
MFQPTSFHSRNIGSACLALSVLGVCCCPPVLSQSGGSAGVQTPAAASDPTKPELQPNLSVDRDPIPSPDPDEPPPSAAPANVPGKAAELQKNKNGTYTLYQDVDEVLLNCAVVDEKGRPVLDLKRDDFRIWEDGVPQVATSFLHQDAPVSMGILIDNSGSMRDKRAAVSQAALEMLRDSNPKDAAFVVNFSDRAYLDQGFTSNFSLLSRALNRFDSSGTTALYDAVAASADELSKHGPETKQVLLVVTDGADNASRLDLRQAIGRVQGLSGPVIYSIGLLYDANDAEAARTRDALEAMSTQTGGVAYFPRSLAEVNSIASQVAQDIRNQYTVGYHSSRPLSLGGYRVVRVEARAAKHGRLIVRTKRGYYARPPQRNPGAPASTQAENSRSLR